jgi:hypothetical protein
MNAGHDRSGAHPIFGEGPNMQHRRCWDLKPDDGGPPRYEWLHITDAAERVERDPRRYRFYFDSDAVPSLAKAV